MSSSRFSNPSKIAAAADSGEAFGISKAAVHIGINRPGPPREPSLPDRRAALSVTASG